MEDHLERVWTKYKDRLTAFVRVRVAEDEVDDIIQEVFVRVHRNLCCKPDWEKPDAWFYQIARNLIIDQYRKRRDHLELPESLPGEIDMEEEDTESRLALSLKEMVDTLPEPYREALKLTEYGGLTQKQLAEQTGLSLSGAKSRVQRARKMLRDMLLQCCHFEFDARGQVMDYYRRCCCCYPESG